MHFNPSVYEVNLLVIIKYIEDILYNSKIKYKTMKFKSVIDTSAILHSNLDFSNGRYLLPNSVLDEIHDETVRAVVHSAIKSGGITIKNPDISSIKKVIEKAKETGDIESLSPADIDVIALAVENNLDILTDDYGIQNVATGLGLKFETIVQEGIRKRVSWKKICEGCKREYEMNSRICRICGSVLKKVPKAPE